MRVFCINPMELANAKGTTITGLAVSTVNSPSKRVSPLTNRTRFNPHPRACRWKQKFQYQPKQPLGRRPERK
jgi:hypothetical protein